MKHLNYRHILFLLLCFTLAACKVSCVESKRGNVTEKVIVNDAKQIVNLNLKEGQEYVVDGVVDLKGGNAVLPANVLISFKKGGALVNGTLTGNETRIKSKYDNVLGVKLNGTWCVDKISDMAFSTNYLTDQQIIENLNTIQSDNISNLVTINRDYEIIIPSSGKAGIKPSSHSKIEIKSTMRLKGNNYKSYQIIDIRGKQDVSIKGGRLIGDVGKHQYIEGTSSEWGMGINIMQSKDVSISGVYITKCTGDGIYISGGSEPSVGIYDNASRNVTVRNVVCDDNRRQGLSIIHVDGLIVRDCSFVNTGCTESTPPSAGIDIEPNVSDNRNMSVRNVVVDNCTITNNKGMAIATNNTYEMEGRVNYENILFSNCKTDGLLKAQSDDVTFRGCTFKEVYCASQYAPTHIVFEKCTIAGGYGIILYAPSRPNIDSKDRLLAIAFNKCIVSVSEDNTETVALLSCYKSYVPNVEYVSFVECEITIPQTEKKYNLTSYSLKGKLRIENTSINMPGHVLDASGVVLKKNRINCSDVTNMPSGTDNIINQ